jgi:hypothetical protein
MDGERLAVSLGRPGEVDVIARTAIGTLSDPATPLIGDFRRDWRRWNAVERICATLLSTIWIVGVTTAILADAHLL